MSSPGEGISNQVVIFGGGVFVNELGQGRLSTWAEQRVSTAIDYYYDHQRRFDTEGGIIVCTGWQTPGFIDRVTPAAIHEADVAADYLVRAGVPHKVVEKETVPSTNTLTNLLSALDGEIIKVEEIDSRNPLGLVSHPHHLKRIELFASRIGIPLEHIQRIATKDRDHRLREFMSRTAWRALISGTDNPDNTYTRQEMVRRQEMVALSVGALLPIAQLTLSKFPF